MALVAPVRVFGDPKPVMVHYMPWFVSKPYSGSWGYHWTLGDSAINPSVTNVNGQAEIASWYYPLIGPYDSADPAVLEYHVLLMKLAGIDGVIVDWYGPDNYYDYGVNNQRTLDIFNYVQKAGLKFSLCYEDATISAEIAGGTMNGITVTSNNAVVHAQQEMLYVQANFFNSPNFLRLSNAPVFLNFGPQFFTQSSQWTTIFSGLSTTNQPAFFTEDNRLSPAAAGAFDWPPMWMSGGGTLTSNQLQSYLINFEQTAKNQSWPNFVSSAFPRFHDYYAQAGGTSYGYLDDNNGITFQQTLTRALTNSSAIVQLVTWNDFGEGTIIEPTVQYGYRDLGVVQNFRRQYLDADFSYTTNDLTLPLRLYNLRKKYGSASPVLSAEMDRIFGNIVSNNLSVARVQLTALENQVPAPYNLTVTDNQLQFFIGGYLSGSGIQIQTSTDLTSSAWQTIDAITVNTNQIQFSAPISQQVSATFFRIQNNSP